MTFASGEKQVFFLAPAIADRLYRSGDAAAGDAILRRLLWLGEKLPYWGDSHRADVTDCRRDTPLQYDIHGCGPGQTMIFGLFGLRPTPELTVELSPHLPPEVKSMSLAHVRMQDKVFAGRCLSNAQVKCFTSFFAERSGRNFKLTPFLWLLSFRGKKVTQSPFLVSLHPIEPRQRSGAT